MLTTYSGSDTVCDIETYCAYGKQRSGTSCTAGNDLDTSKHFTGQDYDSTGLHYYRARYYDDRLGQFISPDTIVPDATVLMDYNRYMYVRGNPMRYNDPSGHGIPYFTGGGSCAQVGMCYEMLSQQAAAKQEAEIDLAVQATASVLVGDVNDVVTVATGYDVIHNESVPYLSEEWGNTVGWAALPFLSRSGARAAEEIADAFRIGDNAVDAAFNDLAYMRRGLGLPVAGSNEDISTLARLDIGGIHIYGINGHGQQTTFSRINAITPTHAEGDVVQQAINAGLGGRGGRATMYVDRVPCQSCGQNGGLRSLARELGVDELEVFGPNGYNEIFIPTK